MMNVLRMPDEKADDCESWTNQELVHELARLEDVKWNLRKENGLLILSLGSVRFMEALHLLYYKSPLLSIAYRNLNTASNLIKPCAYFIARHGLPLCHKMIVYAPYCKIFKVFVK